MSGSAAGEELLEPDSPWLWSVLGLVFAVDVVLFGWWGVTARRERRQAGGTLAVPRHAIRRPRHAPTGRAVTSAASVQEITQRLDRERRVMARRPPRRVAVVRRVVPPAEAGPDTAPFHPVGFPMTTGEEPFVVVGQRGTELVSYTAASAVAAVAVAEYLRCGLHPAIRVEWSLRDDMPHPHPVLLFTDAGDATIHATRLVPGKPVPEHPETCCGTRLDWAAGVTVCTPEMRKPCAGCLANLNEVGESG